MMNWKTFKGSGSPSRVFDKKSELAIPSESPLVIAFSGGRTSGMMLRYYLDTEETPPIVMFANTGKERDETLDFIHEIETQWGCKVTWVELTRVPVATDKVMKIPSRLTRQNLMKNKEMFWYKEVTYETATRHQDPNSPFDIVIDHRPVLPNVVARYCSDYLKVRTMQLCLWDRGVEKFRNAIGFRSDEVDRAYDLIYSASRNKNVFLEFPLAKKGVTQADVSEFWQHQLFDLKLEQHEGNCHLCFLKKRRTLLALINKHPELAEWWRKKESERQTDVNITGDGWKFNRNFSINDLIEESFNYEFSEEDVQDPMTCACTTSMNLSDMAE